MSNKMDSNDCRVPLEKCNKCGHNILNGICLCNDKTKLPTQACRGCIDPNEIGCEDCQCKKTKYDFHAELCDGLKTLYATKNRDYGDSIGKSYAKHGMMAFVIRMEDKLNRIEQLSKKDYVPLIDETMEDALRDLANYALIACAELKAKNE